MNFSGATIVLVVINICYA